MTALTVIPIQFPITGLKTKKGSVTMFHIDATFEMTRMIFTPNGADGWMLTIHENNHGKTSEPIPVTCQQVSDILAINLHPNAEPEGFEAMYERCNPLFRDIGDDLRPIP